MHQLPVVTRKVVGKIISKILIIIIKSDIIAV